MKEGSNMLNGEQELRFTRMFAFFIPLCASASLMNMSHLIINSTLARSIHSETVIAGFAVALSLMAIVDRPLQLFRQTCTILLHDRRAFASISKVSFFLVAGMMLFGITLAFSPLGHILLKHLFSLEGQLLESALLAYRVIIFVYIFSGIRSLYQGVIIANFRTKWLTIGMGIRLIIMYLLSLWFIHTDRVDGSWVGSTIFLVGVMVESIVCYIEGRSLLRKTPLVEPERELITPRHVVRFYRPLVYSSLIFLFISPSINSLLGRTVDYGLSIASFALATNILFLVNGFVFYTHQIAINFYSINRRKTLIFVVIISVIPALIMGSFAFTPLGPWFMQGVMGANERLMLETINILRVFVIYALIFPWLDYQNGIAMLLGRTRILIWSQSVNLFFTICVLFVLILVTPSWNGVIGAIAQTSGVIGELIIVMIGLRVIVKHKSSFST
jgi:hypothetical protein